MHLISKLKRQLPSQLFYRGWILGLVIGLSWGLVAPAVATAAKPIQVRDALGNQLNLAQPALRIISLAPYLTENLFALNAEPALAGTVELSNYPPAAQSIKVIGRYDLLNLEAVLALQPDLILAWASGNHQPQLRQLQNWGVPIYYSEVRTLAQLEQEWLNLGQLTGTHQQAQQLVDNLRTNLQTWRQQIPGPELEVLIQIASDPLITLNGEHFINELLKICGGTNVFAHLPQIAALISYESVFKHNPQVILTGTDDMPNLHAAWQPFSQLQAVQNATLYSLDASLLYQPTPRILQGVELICAALQHARQIYYPSNG